MAIELKQSLKLSQQLVITPQLQQAIKMLQLSRLELVEMVQNEMLENPLLEDGVEEENLPSEMKQDIENHQEGEKVSETLAEVGSKDGELKEPKDFEWENYIQNYSDSGESTRSFNNSDELPSYENFVTKTSNTLHEHLEWQLRLTPLSSLEDEIGVDLIDCIDDNGYLTVSLEDFARDHNYPLEDVEEVLKVIQEFDPTGVGARNLQECLLLQARHFGKERPLLEDLIKNHLDLFQKRDFQSLARRLKVHPKEMAHVSRIISSMEPKPGRPFGRSDTQYITPDVFIHKVGADFIIVLNDEGIPRLRVSPHYKNLPNENGTDKSYVQEKTKNALWLIKSINQRQRTLYRVTKCIVQFQKAFLEHGIEHLKPMILRDVAEEIGVHESTVSRATSNKYVHTPQGLFELKFFFNTGVSDSMDDMTSQTIKEKIRNIISTENVSAPFSDQEIVQLLKKINIDVARRTVAKYREKLRILPSSKRKQFCP